jgi:hypothetical protein
MGSGEHTLRPSIGVRRHVTLLSPVLQSRADSLAGLQHDILLCRAGEHCHQPDVFVSGIHRHQELSQVLGAPNLHTSISGLHSGWYRVHGFPCHAEVWVSHTTVHLVYRFGATSLTLFP